MLRIPYRAYPVVDHIADKVCALLEVHQRYGDSAIASTRYRDLFDLVVSTRTRWQLRFTRKRYAVAWHCQTV